jgi:glycosyltransferase involved in cell wall biosynthesis
MTKKVLHVLSQRPALTGSGVTLDALVFHAGQAGWEQEAVVGIPAGDQPPEVADLPRTKIHPLIFGQGRLPFAVPGMSDIMPYKSTRFSKMTRGQIEVYRRGFNAHLQKVIEAFRPDIIHSHHVWLVSSWLKQISPDIPVVTHCHATGLRQMQLCPHLADTVVQGCRQNDHFAVLHKRNAEDLARALDIPDSKISIVGAGFREDLFHANGRPLPEDINPELVYVGKYSRAKGLPWLLDAFSKLLPQYPKLRLHVAGSGDSKEAAELRARMQALAPNVVLHGQLSQTDLAELMRKSKVMVLPSFYEGLPLVLVEARACGLQIVATALEGIDNELAPHFESDIELVPLPRLENIDQPHQDDQDKFVDDLVGAIDRALSKNLLQAGSLEHFSWKSVFTRVQEIWKRLLADN